LNSGARKKEKSYKTWHVLPLVSMKILENGSYFGLASSMVGNIEKVLISTSGYSEIAKYIGAATPVAKIFQATQLVDFRIWEIADSLSKRG
jgi:hypothetical protein